MESESKPRILNIVSMFLLAVILAVNLVFAFSHQRNLPLIVLISICIAALLTSGILSLRRRGRSSGIADIIFNFTLSGIWAVMTVLNLFQTSPYSQIMSILYIILTVQWFVLGIRRLRKYLKQKKAEEQHDGPDA